MKHSNDKIQSIVSLFIFHQFSKSRKWTKCIKSIITLVKIEIWPVVYKW